MDLVIKLIICLLCGVFGAWGGYSWNVARRYGIPLALSLYLCIDLHTLFGLWTLTAIPLLCLGYGENAPLAHIFGMNWGRGVWGLLVALAISLPLVISHHLSLTAFLAYLVIGFSLEPLCKKLWQVAGDLIIFSGFGLIVFLIH